MLKINNLSLKLNNIDVLKNINVYVKRYSITAIIGKNASGKTSLIKCINGIYNYNGKILLNDKNISNMKFKDIAKEMSILPQILKYPHIKVDEIITMGRNPYLGLNCKLSDIDIKIKNETIDRLKIKSLLNKYLDELSGGQRQLVYLAMQLIQDASLMIFDEPSSFMDINYENFFLKTLKDLQIKDKKTILVVMHNINQIIKYADNIIVIDSGEIVFEGTTQQCIDNEIIEKTFSLKKYKFNDVIIFES